MSKHDEKTVELHRSEPVNWTDQPVGNGIVLPHWDGIGWDGMHWDGMGWDGVEVLPRWDGIGWNGMGWDGSFASARNLQEEPVSSFKRLDCPIYQKETLLVRELPGVSQL